MNCAPVASSTFLYSLDDGTGESGLSFQSAVDMIFLNQFNVLGQNKLIESLSFSWINSILTDPGIQATLAVWNDVNNDGSPQDAVLLNSQVIDIFSAPVNTFLTYDIPDTLVDDSFFVGVMVSLPANLTVARTDLSSGLGRSWIAWNSPGNGDISNLAGNGGTLNSLAAYNIPANWMIRATALPVPLPGSLLLMVAGIACCRIFGTGAGRSVAVSRRSSIARG